MTELTADGTMVLAIVDHLASSGVRWVRKFETLQNNAPTLTAGIRTDKT
jgi:hypothetical protein